MEPDAKPQRETVQCSLDVRRMTVGHFEVRRDGVCLAEIRSITHGSRPGWIVRYRASGRAVPHFSHRVFASRAAAIESVGA